MAGVFRSDLRPQPRRHPAQFLPKVDSSCGRHSLENIATDEIASKYNAVHATQCVARTRREPAVRDTPVVANIFTVAKSANFAMASRKILAKRSPADS
jgi:hypothetical protein